MVKIGLIGMGVAVLCLWAGVISTARADRRNGGTSRLRGAPRVWMLAALTLAGWSVLAVLAGLIAGW